MHFLSDSSFSRYGEWVPVTHTQLPSSGKPALSLPSEKEHVFLTTQYVPHPFLKTTQQKAVQCLQCLVLGNCWARNKKLNKVYVLFFFFFSLVMPRGMQDLSFRPGINGYLCGSMESLNHWMVREVPVRSF